MLTVKITYQGKHLTERFYNEHPEIHHMYPGKKDFMERLYLPLVRKMEETNEQQILEISENMIRVNGVVREIT